MPFHPGITKTLYILVNMSKLLSFLEETPAPAGFKMKVGDSCTSKTINGIEYDIYTSKEGVVTKERCSNYYETMFGLIEEEFPNSPFDVSLSRNDLLRLDKPFTNENYIIIIDKRTQSHVKVEQLDNNPITLRQILHQLISTPSYDRHTDHHFLEYFRKNDNVHYTACFGS
jgi:hypothetical protein